MSRLKYTLGCIGAALAAPSCTVYAQTAPAPRVVQVPIECTDTSVIIERYKRDGKHWKPLATIATPAGGLIVLIIDTRDKETHTWFVLNGGQIMCYIDGGTLSTFNLEALGLKQSGKGM
jgi:hypothetical protein